MNFEEKRLYQNKLKTAVLLFILAILLGLASRLVLTPHYDMLKEDIAQTAVLAKQITTLSQEAQGYVRTLADSGKVYSNLATQKDSYVSFLGDITLANQLNINKMTVGDIVKSGGQLYSMKVQIELQGDLYNVKNLVQQLYDSETVSRINTFSYRLQSDDGLQWMWREVDEEALVPWYDLIPQPAENGNEEEDHICADDLMAHNTALCYLEVEFLGTGG